MTVNGVRECFPADVTAQNQSIDDSITLHLNDDRNDGDVSWKPRMKKAIAAREKGQARG